MGRKSSAKKDTASAESKTEAGTTRRSGRSVTKQETPAVGKEASRSRRGSTAAATAASVADTKSSKGRTPTSRRDSTSPSEARSHKKRKESEEPSRKTARRATSRVNYKESDGEEEGPAPKFDDAFDSNDELDDSESDEKSKPKVRGKAVKTPAKGRGSKGKGKKSRSSRGRPKKESSDEEDEDEPPIELSEDSVEVDEESTGKQVKETTRSGRSRKPKADDTDAKPKSRRSGRAGAKEESPRKRPTRGVQAKKYTEEEDDDIEEIDNDKEVEKTEEGGRKRKRSLESEPNKRLKDEDANEKEDEDETEEKSSNPKDEPEKDQKDDDEPMDVDDEKKVDESSAKKVEKESNESAEKDDETSEVDSTAKESSFQKKEGSENLDEDMHDSDEDSEDVEETKSDKKPGVEETKIEKSETQVEDTHDSSNSIQDLDKSPELKRVSETHSSNEPNTIQDNTETNAEKISTESLQNDILPDSKSKDEKQHGAILKESISEASQNGSEDPPSNTAPVIQTTNSVNLHAEESAPTENGAHDLHSNSVSESDQYYPFPGRKYVLNTKLGESIRQSAKEKSFGFVSYNLGFSPSDSSIPKEKLLNELNKLDAHIICIQQVSKPFYSSILEPSLDALGFKGTFSLPPETGKGIATFYKSSLFRLSGQSEASLKHLIEKELETPSLDANGRIAVKTHVKQCGHVLFTHFAPVIGMHSLTVANVQIPPSDLSVHALQVSCLAKEVAKVNGGTNKPFLLGGEFNMLESEAPYQLLKDGYLSNDMIEELQRRKDIALPGKENEALVNLLWKSFQHPSSTLCSCYKSVLDHEVFIPEQKSTSPDLLWYSSDSLYTIGVLDASEIAGDRHFSLKADIAFSM